MTRNVAVDLAAPATDTRRLGVDPATWQLDRFFELSLDLLALLGADGYFKRLSPVWATVTGWSLADLCSRPFIDFVHPADQARTLAEAAKLTQGAKSVEFVNRYVCRDGTILWLEWNAVGDLSGDTTYCAARDISELRRSESALREKAALVDLSHDAIIVLDVHDLRIRYWNPGAQLLYGYSADEAQGKVVSELLRTVLPQPLDDILQQTRLGTWDGGEFRQWTKDGRELYIESRWALQKDEAGAEVGILEVNRDVTSRRQAETALRAANESLEERVHQRTAELEGFTYSVSHDLRTPLRALNGFVDVLVEDQVDRLDGDGLDALNEIKSNALRMGRLIDDLLAFSRLGRQELRVRPVDMASIATSATEALRSVIDGTKIRLTIEPMPRCLGDPALLEQVYVNLIANAVKFSAGCTPSIITVGATQIDGTAAYYVSDNGVGFDMKYVDKLFSVFQRLHAQDEFEGTGVGLATVKLIVARHGGRTWAKAQPDHGATFYFTIGGTENV